MCLALTMMINLWAMRAITILLAVKVTIPLSPQKAQTFIMAAEAAMILLITATLMLVLQLICMISNQHACQKAQVSQMLSKILST